MIETMRLGERLVEQGLISRNALEQSLELQQKRPDWRLEECLVSLEAIGERTLLQFVASELKTRYVSTANLSKMRIEDEVLDRIPVRFAEAQRMVPILFDAGQQALTVVMADPEDTGALSELKFLTGVAQVVPYLGARPAIQAAIRANYYRDFHAFDDLVDPAAAREALNDDSAVWLTSAPAAGERSDASDDVVTSPAARAPAQPPPLPEVQTTVLAQNPLPVDGLPGLPGLPGLTGISELPEPPPDAAPEPARPVPPAPGPEKPTEIRLAAPARVVLEGRQATSQVALPANVNLALELVQRPSLFGDEGTIEALNVLVGMLDSRRRDPFRGHSTTVARHARALAQRLGLSPAEVNEVTVAGLLHDLGKRPERHLTLLAVAEDQEWKAEARRLHQVPAKLFEMAPLPPRVKETLDHLYAAFDGSGVPFRIGGKAIPIGARILAAVDSYEDLTRNDQNVRGRLFLREAAFDELLKHTGTLFDPSVVELLHERHAGDPARTGSLAQDLRAPGSQPDQSARTAPLDVLARLGLDLKVTLSSGEAAAPADSGEYAPPISQRRV